MINGQARPAVIRARSAVHGAQPEAEAKVRNQLALPWAGSLARSSLGACGRTTRQSGGVASAVLWSLGEAASGAVEQGDEADEASAGATAGRRRRRMPARGPFLARAPLRSLSPLFDRRGSGLRAFVEANGSGQRKKARAFGAIWIFFFSLLGGQVNGPALLHVPWRSSSGRSSGDKRPGQFGCYQGQIGCSGGAARGGSEGTEPAGVALGLHAFARSSLGAGGRTTR